MASSIGLAIVGMIPELVGLGVRIANAVKGNVDEERWANLGPEIEQLITMAMNGEDISHEDIMPFIPRDLSLEVLQLKKKKERIEAGLPVAGDSGV